MTDDSTRDRIRDVAIDLFGRDGIAATGVRAIASAAGVSPALVLHHFGSKDGLRRACDEHIVSTIREAKTAAALDPQGSMGDWTRQTLEFAWLLRYLRRAVVEGGDLAQQLFTDLVTDAEGYLAEWQAAGIIRPVEDQQSRAAFLAALSLGNLVVRPLVAAYLGVAEEDEAVLRFEADGAMDVFTRGLFVDEAVGDALRGAMTPTDGAASGETAADDQAAGTTADGAHSDEEGT